MAHSYMYITFFLRQPLPGGAQVATQLSIMTHLQDKGHVVTVFKVVVQFEDGWVLEAALDLYLVPYSGNHTACLHQLLVNLNETRMVYKPA